MPYQVIAHYRATSSTAEQVAELLPLLAAATRTEPGCLAYAVTRDLEDATHFVIVETYRGAEDLQVHRDTPHFRELGIGRIIPLLASREVVAGELGPV